MYLTMYQLDQHLKQIAALVHQSEDPPGAARYSMRELADRTGLKVLVVATYVASSERLRQAGAEVLDGLRDGLAVADDASATLAAAKALLANLGEEVTAFEQGEDYTGGGGGEAEYLLDAWGPGAHG